MTCSYCPNEALPDATICGYHADREAACNIAEDEGNGHIHGPRVDELMREWGHKV
jgi:hypothetical protein